jgi:Tfp pilus assembly protein PilO
MKLRRPDSVELRHIARMLVIDLLRIVHHAGGPALLAGVLAIASLAIALSTTLPMREQITAVEQQRKQLRVASRNKTPEAASPQTRLREFYASFPPRSSLPEALMTLHRAARKNNLRDTRADYRDAPEAGTPLVRVRIDIPVTGSYPDIRSWVAELLKTLPSLTLDGLELRRNGIGNPNLEARVRFQYLLRGTP